MRASNVFPAGARPGNGPSHVAQCFGRRRQVGQDHRPTRRQRPREPAMTFTETDLRAAAAAGALDTAQLARLLDFLHQRSASLPVTTEAPSRQFDVAHLLWYAGALIVMTAMGLFSTLAFSQMGGEALAVTALVYAAGFAAAGHYLWHGKGLRTPGGLLIAIAVSMAPLAVYGIQDAYGIWGQFGKPGTVQGFYVWIKGSWIFMEPPAAFAPLIA